MSDAKGCTTSDVPMVMSRSAFFRSVILWKNLDGSDSLQHIMVTEPPDGLVRHRPTKSTCNKHRPYPKKTICGLTRPWHVLHRQISSAKTAFLTYSVG